MSFVKIGLGSRDRGGQSMCKSDQTQARVKEATSKSPDWDRKKHYLLIA